LHKVFILKHQYIVSPYFLANELLGLKNIMDDDWIFNAVNINSPSDEEKLKAIHKSLANHCSEALTKNILPISVVGDCCSSIAVSAALQKANLNPILVWFDAHGDFNTFETTLSGHLGGMPLAMLAGVGNLKYLNACEAKPYKQTQIILTDGRDLDPEEKILIEKSSITHYKSIDEILNHSFQNRNVYVHFDTDILQPSDAPAQNYLAEGGPTLDELKKVFNYLSKQNIVAISVSSWNPELDLDQKTEQTCMSLLKELIPTK